jgi:hypothetical protein
MYVLLLLSIVVTAIMAPITNHVYLPYYDNYIYHLHNIVEAHAAILQGHFFWLRVAPGLFNGWSYPEFQFYSPSAYTIAAYIYFICAQHPFLAYKLTLGLVLVLGAWYSYRLYVFLFNNKIAALLGAILYLFSPYLLANINVRGDFTEAFAQGVVPIVAYYVFRLFYCDAGWVHKLYFLLLTALSTYVLATAHLITFLYSSLFIGLLFLSLGMAQKKIKNLVWVFLGFIVGVVLAFWYLVPVIETAQLLVVSRNNLASPWNTHWLTYLPAVLAPKGLSPGPFAVIPVYAGIGLPLTFALGYWLYRWLYERALDLNLVRGACFIKILLSIFILALIMLWSGFDFWRFLPHEFYVVQFTYRLLTQVMWLGGLLFVAALVDLFGAELQRVHLVFGSILLMLSGAGWMYNNYINGFVRADLSLDSAYYNVSDYLVMPQAVTLLPQYSLADNKNLWPVTMMAQHCQQVAGQLQCTVSIMQPQQALQLPILYYPRLLKITVNGQSVDYHPSAVTVPLVADNTLLVRQQVVATIDLAPGHYQLQAGFIGVSWANVVSALSWLIYLFIFFGVISRIKFKFVAKIRVMI